MLESLREVGSAWLRYLELNVIYVRNTNPSMSVSVIPSAVVKLKSMY